MVSLTWRGALAWRMRRHLLDPIGSSSTTAVVSTLGAVAAQLDPVAAELGIRTRCRSSGAGDVRSALDAGRLIETFAFRGAVHLMTPEDAGVYLALRAASRMWERPSWQEYYRLTPADWPALREVVRTALADGPMTRVELAAAVAAEPRFRHLVPALTHPSATLLKPLAWQGDVSLGPSRDGQMTLQRLDANPRWTGMPGMDEAGRRAIEAYLRAYGPVSADNITYWLGEGLGVTRALIRGWMSRLAECLVEVRVDGEPRLVLGEDIDELVATSPAHAVRFLPRYDQWVLGPGTADVHVVPPAVRSKVSRGANLVVAGGIVAGTWSLEGDAVVTSWSGDPPASWHEQLDGEVARLAAIVGRPLRRAGRDEARSTPET